VVTGFSGAYDGLAPGVVSGSATGVNNEALSGLVVVSTTYCNVPGGAVHWTFSNPNYADQQGNATVSISTVGSAVAVLASGAIYDGSLHGGTASWSSTGAASLPNTFGVHAGSNNLTGKSNAYIAALFQSDFVLKGVKLDAQELATALAVYATNASLDDTLVAAGVSETLPTPTNQLGTYSPIDGWPQRWGRSIHSRIRGTHAASGAAATSRPQLSHCWSDRPLAGRVAAVRFADD
jgi:hypothetical protein